MGLKLESLDQEIADYETLLRGTLEEADRAHANPQASRLADRIDGAANAYTKHLEALRYQRLDLIESPSVAPH
jgi:hypothetical protein